VIGENRLTFQKKSDHTITGLIRHRKNESTIFEKME
jgi:hypothetical protein